MLSPLIDLQMSILCARLHAERVVLVKLLGDNTYF